MLRFFLSHCTLLMCIHLQVQCTCTYICMHVTSDCTCTLLADCSVDAHVQFLWKKELSGVLLCCVVLHCFVVSLFIMYTKYITMHA